jgi:hypothetical protein
MACDGSPPEPQLLDSDVQRRGYGVHCQGAHQTPSLSPTVRDLEAAAKSAYCNEHNQIIVRRHRVYRGLKYETRDIYSVIGFT